VPVVHEGLQGAEAAEGGHVVVHHEDDLDAGVRCDLHVIANDTLIAAGDTIRGPVLVLGGLVRIDGIVQGDLVLIDANVFLRPRAHIMGDVLNIGGGFYPSEDRTQVDGVITSRPNAPYDVDRDPDHVRIIGTNERALFALDGLKGLVPPTYDRVDGLSIGTGATYMFPPIGLVEPILHGWGAYHTRTKDFSGGGELAFRRRANEIAVGGSRATLTNEEWIRGDILNSLAFLFQGRDYRNYYRSDRGWVELRRRFEADDPRTTIGTITARIENDASLEAGDPWTVLSIDSIRPNPPVSPGRISSLLFGLSTEWTHPTTKADMKASVELAGTVAGGDHEFAAFDIEGVFAMRAIANHTLEVDWKFLGPLPGTDSLPRQRWSFVGGSGTLYTFDLAQFQGDRLAMVETSYSIPMPAAIRLPLLGRPSLEFLHHIGMAWTRDSMPSLEQNVGARIRFPFVWVRFAADPDDFPSRSKVSVGVSLPRLYPWRPDATG
jgi:hypothetical protein